MLTKFIVEIVFPHHILIIMLYPKTDTMSYVNDISIISLKTIKQNLTRTATRQETYAFNQEILLTHFYQGYKNSDYTTRKTHLNARTAKRGKSKRKPYNVRV